VTGPLGPVEVLGQNHQLDGFRCSSFEQTSWLIQYARQSNSGGMTRVFVVNDQGLGRVVGYYALAAAAMATVDVPGRLTVGAGGYQMPLVLLARLGRDQERSGSGLGARLLVDAFQRVDRLSRELGFKALLIDVETEQAKAWYMSLAAFDENPANPLQLFLLMKDLRRAIP